MSGLETTFLDCGLEGKRPIVVGFSGGPDSLVLLHKLRAAGYILLAAHLDHGLRPESAKDAEEAARLAADMGVEFVSERQDVGGYAEEHNLSVEAAARQLRYAFLFGLATVREAQAVAVGHTADDQVETVLMHWLRGAGTAGLAGMQPRAQPNAWSESIPLVRPLLATWRREVLAYGEAQGLTPIMDPSNRDSRYTRNQIRHELLLALEVYNPSLKQAIWQNADVLAADFEVLHELAEESWRRCLAEAGGEHVLLDRKVFSAQPLALQRLLLRKAFGLLRPGDQQLDYAAVQRALAQIAAATSAGRQDWLAGISLRVSEDRIAIEEWVVRPVVAGPQIKPGLEVHIEVPGEYSLGGDWRLLCSKEERALSQVKQNIDPYQAWLDAKKSGELLTLRTRRPGDLFQPLGMQGSMKLSDFMVNSKMPAPARAGWPLLCKGEEILWVPGYQIAEPFRLKAQGTSALYVQVRNAPA